MNEVLVLLETLSRVAWVYLAFVLVLAVGLLLFDRPSRGTAKSKSEPRERLAA